MKTLIFCGDIFEESELLKLLNQLQGTGHSVEIASHVRGTIIRGLHGGKVVVNKAFAEVDQSDYAVLILLGGNASAMVRNEPKVQEISRDFFGESSLGQSSATAIRR